MRTAILGTAALLSVGTAAANAKRFPPWGFAAGQYAHSPDGQRFLMIRNVDPWDTSAAPKRVLVQNFFEELRARAGGR